jgi:hypothetical protein
MTRLGLGATAMVALQLGCGGGPRLATPPRADGAAPVRASPVSRPAPSATERRLEGRWEVVDFRPKNPIPDEARPLVTRLVGSIRLRFSGRTLFASVGAEVEEHDFSVSDEQGESFRLRVPGGMFDGAWARFREDGTLELVDDGNPWPGVSTLRRLTNDGALGSP